MKPTKNSSVDWLFIVCAVIIGCYHLYKLEKRSSACEVKLQRWERYP